MALSRNAAWWTYDVDAEAYYFAPATRTQAPYRTQLRAAAILDIADDGTLAGVELAFGDLPPPPGAAPAPSRAETTEQAKAALESADRLLTSAAPDDKAAANARRAIADALAAIAGR